MLFVYARHSVDCKHRRNIYYKKCKCPKWIDGYLDGKRHRKSAKTRSWRKATDTVRKMDPSASEPSFPEAAPGKPAVAPIRTTIAAAVREFMEDERGRNLGKQTTKQSKTLLDVQLLPWAKQQNLISGRTDSNSPPPFRASWSNCGSTSNRKLTRLSGFFRFCLENKWITENPTARIKRAVEDAVPTGWFAKDEFERIVDGTYAYGDWHGGRDFEFRADRLRALVLVMRWSGLSIQDAVTLDRERLNADGELFLYRAKTKVPVFVPIPPDVVTLLRSLPNVNPRYFFWSGKGDPQTACKGWRRSLKRLFGLVKLQNGDGTPKRCHPHMFRDTFAIELLNNGTPIHRRPKSTMLPS